MQQIKQEPPSEAGQNIKDESNGGESLVEMIHTKQEARDNFFKQEVMEVAAPEPKKYDAEQFKKFLLACMWEKRIPKNEILIMDLA